jgi:hypothetical protein
MKHDALVGAMYGLLVPFVMPFVAYWTRKVNYWAFFAVGGLSIPAFSLMSVGIRQGWNVASTEVLPRVVTIEGGLISIGFGMSTVAFVWIARASGLERTAPGSDTDRTHMAD